MATPKTLKAQFDTADGARKTVLDRARECAELTLPSVLPRENTTQDNDLVRPYQSLGAYGSTNLTNKLLLTQYPVGVPWFQSVPSARLRADGTFSQEAMDKFLAILYMRDLIVRDQLESSRLRISQRTAFEQIVILGNTLSVMNDDYSIKVFRLDQYVQKRANSGKWLWVITHEKLDPAEVTEDMLAKLGKTQEEIDAKTEGLDLYTKCTRHANGSTTIVQELEGVEIGRSEEPVSRFFPAGYVELPGENYSRGFIEERLGSLRSYNGLTKAILDGAVICSKFLIGIDTDRQTSLNPSDFAKASGSVIAGIRVIDGKWDGVGLLQAEKNADMAVAFQAASEIGKELSSQMLVESAVQPEGERVTAYQVNRIARELEGATGGVTTHISEDMQAPIVKYTMWKMDKENKLPPLPEVLKKEINVELLTGLEAMSRQRDLEKLQTIMQIIAVDPELLKRWRPEWINNIIVRGMGVDPTQALKTEEKLEEENAKLMEMQMQMQAAQVGLQTAGKVVENASKPQATRQGGGM